MFIQRDQYVNELLSHRPHAGLHRRHGGGRLYDISAVQEINDS